MNDEAIHIPARKKQQTGAQMVVKVTPEAYNALVEIYNESTLSLKQIDAGIQLVILVEHGPDVKNLEDVWFWQNPRKHEVRWRMVNGKREKYVVSAKAVDGKQLYKSMCTIRDRYNVRFEFCEKKDTGKEIMRILSEYGDAK